MIDTSKIHHLLFKDGHKRQIKFLDDGSTKGHGKTWKLINGIVYVFDENRFAIGEFNESEFENKDTIKTLIFCTAYITPLNINRYVNWYNYYKLLFPDFDLIMSHDGPLLIDNSKYKLPIIINEPYIGIRNKNGKFSGWIRGFLEALKYSQENNYNYIAHLESDCYVKKDYKSEFIKLLKSGDYISSWCERYNFMETAIQIFNKDTIDKMIYYFSNTNNKGIVEPVFEKEFKPKFLIRGNRIENFDLNLSKFGWQKLDYLAQLDYDKWQDKLNLWDRDYELKYKSGHPIQSAKWGIEDKYIDVTDKARQLFDKHGKVDASNKYFGDPIYGKRKHLKINENIKVHEHTALYKDFTTKNIMYQKIKFDRRKQFKKYDKFIISHTSIGDIVCSLNALENLGKSENKLMSLYVSNYTNYNKTKTLSEFFNLKNVVVENVDLCKNAPDSNFRPFSAFGMECSWIYDWPKKWESLYYGQEYMMKAKSYSTQIKDTIGISFTVNFKPEKNISIKSIKKLIDKLLNDNKKIIYFGAKETDTFLEEYKDKIKIMTDKDDLTDIMKNIQSCEHFYGADSGMAWLSVFSEVPTTIIVGTSFGKNLPKTFSKIDYCNIEFEDAFFNSKIYDTFNNIYLNGGWANQGSGPGSNPKINKEYIDILSSIIKYNDIKTIVDIGCGDWQIMSNLNLSDKLYTGLDASEFVIKNNILKYGKDNIKFINSNAVDDNIPNGDLVIIKDCIQHLCNSDVMKILNKISHFKYALITNDYCNINTRDTNAGGHRPLNLTEPPFNFRSNIIYTYRGKAVYFRS